jgi:hypothetical protein
VNDDGTSDISEEDLASTFDGDYSGMEYDEGDFDSEDSTDILKTTSHLR